MKNRVIIVGDGGHAKVVCDILEMQDCYEIIGVTSNNSTEKGFQSYPIIGDDIVLDDSLYKGVNIALGIGGFRNNTLRKNLYIKLKKKGFKIVSAIHPSAVIAKTAQIGEGSVIFAGVVLNPDVKVGDNTIIATGSTIDHESIIGNHVLVSAGVTIGGYTNIGDETLCALGCKIVSGIHVGKKALIAAGAVVVKDVYEDQVVYGIPARPKS